MAVFKINFNLGLSIKFNKYFFMYKTAVVNTQVKHLKIDILHRLDNKYVDIQHLKIYRFVTKPEIIIIKS